MGCQVFFLVKYLIFQIPAGDTHAERSRSLAVYNAIVQILTVSIRKTDNLRYRLFL
jgi:hypothetical protein